MRKPRLPLVSIVVNNYNYGRFLPTAIDSALNQRYPRVEVVVVDDGSTDDSREVISKYRDRVVAVLQSNSGQASAFNAGIKACHGDIIIFLDSDDALTPYAAEKAAAEFVPGVVKVHWPLLRADDDLRPTGQTIPGDDLPSGDLRAETMRDGPGHVLSPPTSGNAWSREFLEMVSPIPEAEHVIGADGYLYGLAPAFGEIRRVDSAEGLYRIHSSNGYKHLAVHERVKKGVRSFECQVMALKAHAENLGVQVDQERWRRNSFFVSLSEAIGAIEHNIPDGATFVLMDSAQWGVEHRLGDRPIIPFMERNRIYWGLPESAEAAVEELLRTRHDYHPDYLVIGWPAYWWLDANKTFADHLDANLTKVFASDLLKIYALQSTLNPQLVSAWRSG